MSTPVVLGKPIAPVAPAGQPSAPLKAVAPPAKLDKPQFEPNLLLTKDNLDDAVGYETVESSTGLPARGYCRKCGWQTHQTNEADARAAVLDHAKRHVAGFGVTTPGKKV
jgi:hypothetical protein